jgi:PAS domain S-box-containing protein
MKFISQNKTQHFYVIAFIALVSILSVLFYNSLTIKSSSNLVDHTKNVMHKSDIILVDILNIETGSRGYVLMGDTTFLEPYKTGLSKINNDLEALRRITDNNFRQQTRFDSLSNTIFKRIALSKALVEAKRQNILNGTLQNSNIKQGKVLTDSIRHLIVAINSEKLLLLKDRKIANENNFENSAFLYLISFLLIIFILVIVAIILKNQKSAELEYEELFSSQEQLSQYSLSLIEASLDPLFVISPQGKITDTNQATARVTGVSKEQLIGSDFIDYFTEPQKAKEVYLEVFTKGHVSDYPLTITDGELVDVLFNGAVYTNEKNKVIGAVVVARDITKQKQTEKELIEAKIFAELATAIAEEAKINAENAADLAKDAVKSKQQFLSNMSHEIRTPMNAIIGFTKVVLKTNLTAKQKEYLTAIKMSGDALIVLINDILDLAKVNSGKMVFEKTPFKLSLSISAMLHLFETKIQEKNLKLITKYDNKIPEVLVGDAVRLHQIILNLVSNAVKFTSKGTINVEVNLIENQDDIVVVEFMITDTGIGINTEKIQTIFENFQQATSGTSRLYGGTGLGLAIVKQLVEAQEGSIRVESKVDHGSSFIFSLPFDKTNAEAVLVEEIIELDTEVKDIKILVVEDMELNQLLMKTLLDDFGFECDISANGKLAIEKLQDKSYDIILMDLQMPEMNGFDATEYIRKTMKLTVPIMALTADVTTVDLAKCKAVGMNDYVAKPIDERLLYSKIIGLVKKPILIIEEKISDGMKTEKIKYVDLQYLNKLTKSNPKLMTDMIQVYLKQTPPLIETMKQSLANEDWISLKSAAHKLIPSFTIMGISSDFEKMAHKIQEYASNIESMGNINELILQLEVVCNSAYIELENELNTIKNTTV